MFVDNKYHRWYLELIRKAKIRQQISAYVEIHHIIPKCAGGANEVGVKGISQLKKRELNLE